jgi:hypothetical protein
MRASAARSYQRNHAYPVRAQAYRILCRELFGARFAALLAEFGRCRIAVIMDPILHLTGLDIDDELSRTGSDRADA